MERGADGAGWVVWELRGQSQGQVACVGAERTVTGQVTVLQLPHYNLQGRMWASQYVQSA